MAGRNSALIPSPGPGTPGGRPSDLAAGLTPSVCLAPFQTVSSSTWQVAREDQLQGDPQNRFSIAGQIQPGPRWAHPACSMGGKPSSRGTVGSWMRGRERENWVPQSEGTREQFLHREYMAPPCTLFRTEKQMVFFICWTDDQPRTHSLLQMHFQVLSLLKMGATN